MQMNRPAGHSDDDSAPPPSPARAAGFNFDAFGSYSTGSDYRLVRRVEAFLETFHRLPNPSGSALPELAFCVDGSDFSVARALAAQRKRSAAGLVNEIEELIAGQLRQSQRLLVFCPGRKLQGRWSDWETQWFLAQHRREDIYLVITRGRDPWSDPSGFFPESIVAAGLHHRIAYDLRGARWWHSWRWKNVRDFDDELTRLVADLYDRSLGEVQPVWIRQRKRMWRLIVRVAVSVSFALLVVTAFALFQRSLANERRLVAERQTRLANARQLAAQSSAALGQGFPQRSLLLAVEALRATESAGEPPVIDAEQALRAGLSQTGGTPLRGHRKPIDSLALSPDGRWLATCAEDGQLLLWNPAQPATSRPLETRAGVFKEVRFSPDSRWLAALGSQSVEVWNLGNSTAPLFSETSEESATQIWFSPGSRWLATSWEDGAVLLRDLQAPLEPARRLESHQNPVTDLAFTPDEIRLVTASDKQVYSERTSTFSMEAAARVWNLQDLASGPRVLTGHDGAIECLALSADGLRLLTGGSDRTVKVWDLPSDPAAVRWTLSGHIKGVSGLAISPSGRWAASGGFDGVANIWDLEAADPNSSAVKLSGHGGTVLDVEFSSDGRWLLTHGTDENDVRLWAMDGSRPAERTFTLRGHRALVQIAHFSKDSRWVLTAGDDKVARLWDLNAVDPSAKPIVFAGQEDSVSAVSLAADGQWLALASGVGDWVLPRVDPTARLWNLRTPAPAASPEVLAVEGEGGVAVTRSDGAWIATPAAENRVRLWRRSDGRIFDLAGHTDNISCLLFSDDYRWLATTSEEGTAQLFDLQLDDPSTNAIRLTGHPGAIVHAAWSPDSQWLATGDNENTAMLWDARASDPARSGQALVHPDMVTALVWTADGKHLVTGCSDDAARIWKPGATRPLHTLPGHDENVNILAISRDDHWLATSPLYRGAVHLWNLQASDPAKEGTIFRDHQSAIRGIIFSADGRWMITQSSDPNVQLYDLLTSPLKARALAGHLSEVTTLALSADSRWLATGSADGMIRLWNLRGPDPSADSIPFRGHSDRIRHLVFTPSSEYLLSGSADGTVRRWRVSGTPTWEQPLVLPAGKGEVLSLEVVADRFLITGASEGIRIWPLSPDQLATEAHRVAGRELRPDEAAFLPLPTPRDPTLRERFGILLRRWRSLVSGASYP